MAVRRTWYRYYVCHMSLVSLEVVDDREGDVGVCAVPGNERCTARGLWHSEDGIVGAPFHSFPCNVVIMSSPPVVVVQGTPVPQNQAFTGVSNNNHQQHPSSNAASHPDNGNREDKVESSCNDPIFAVLFYIALFFIVGVASTYGVDAVNNSASTSSSNTTQYNYSGFVTVTVIITVLSFGGAGLGMSLLFCIPQFLIKAALIFTVVLAGAWCVIAFAFGNLIGGIIGVIFFAITVCYAFAVWSRIPFATANLVTACTAIRANLGVAVYAYIFALLAGLWAICWSVAFAGVFDSTYDCMTVNGQNVCSSPSYGLLFVLFLAFFFVQQVIQVRLALLGIVLLL
jgi:Plasma-membrane choline transporter